VSRKTALSGRSVLSDLGKFLDVLEAGILPKHQEKEAFSLISELLCGQMRKKKHHYVHKTSVHTDSN
jgi:hypothetical protein